MIQVTAILNDNEIGYGEGETRFYAMQDCAASISPMFEDQIVELSIITDGVLRRAAAKLFLTINGDIAFV